MSANERQVGGKHYKTEYEHWDLVIKVRMNYLQGNTTKYVSRARKKGGLQDYRKALHYLDKLIECYEAHLIWEVGLPLDDVVYTEVNRFGRANDLTLSEEFYIYKVCTASGTNELITAKELLEEVIREMQQQALLHKVEEPNYPGTPEDGGHHACNPK